MKVSEVVDKIIDACHVSPIDQTCDQLIEGDWNAEVTGIVTTFMATADVINQAIASGANLIISHEPIYFTGRDSREWLQEDEVYRLKRNLIEEHHINVWRFHDHMHRMKPDLIYVGLNKELGWETFQKPDIPHYYTIPETTVEELTLFLKKKLNVETAQIIGSKDARVQKVGFLVGGMSLGLNLNDLPMKFMDENRLEVLVCGEILEWIICSYIRDASALGLNRSMIILGHNRTEEVGMKYLPDWLRPLFPGMPILFVEAGDPFTYL